MAHHCVNADCSVQVGKEATTRLTGLSYADAKLKRNNKVTSMGAVTNSKTVRGKDV